MRDSIATRWASATRRVREFDRVQKLILWLALIACGTVFALGAILGSFYTAFLDTTDPQHQSPNTPLGWTVACATMASSVGAARWLRSRTLLVTAYGLLIPQWYLWYWILVGPGQEF